MNPTLAILAGALTFGTSWFLTRVYRRYAVTRGVWDTPNIRSAHAKPTSRGGGVSIFLCVTAAAVLFWTQGVIDTSLFAAISGGGVIVATIGFFDDHKPMRTAVRAVVHGLAAAWASLWLGTLQSLDLGWTIWNLHWLGDVLTFFGLIWMTNLYNFMDGIDGLAGLEAVFAGTCGGGIILVTGGRGDLALLAWVTASAAAGFLVWNWPPAKIFMGDVGSGFLGFVFGVLAISSAKERPWLLWPWLILLSVFIVDSTLTLMRRLITGARWYEAHCSHAYQHAARRWGSHSKVTLTIAAVNVAWLFPLAWGACVWPAVGPLFAVVALAPLVYTAFRYDAGHDTSAAEVACSEAEVRVAVDSQA
jgi:Fuc2NAc and GlcNAc transferase